MEAVQQCTDYAHHVRSADLGSMAYDAFLRNLAVIGAAVRSAARDPRVHGNWYRVQYHGPAPSAAKTLDAMRANPRNIAYDDLAKVCAHYLGPPRTTGGVPCSVQDPLAG